MPQDPSIDNVLTRNSTKVFILINGARVGRVQSFQESINNNVQVLRELGRAYNVEMKKGVTEYAFSIAKLYTRADVFDSIKLGQAVFSISARDSAPAGDDGSGSSDIIEFLPQCMVQSCGFDITSGQVAIAMNVSCVAIGKGLTTPQTAS